MPNYVPYYKHDIFVSYAYVDNQPFPEADRGWVTTLINGLKNFLGRKLGKSDAYSLWMDYELSGNINATPDTIEQLEKAATFVLILSPAYLASEQCCLELSVFLAKAGKNSGRVFVVEHDKVETRPDELSDLLGYRFWKSDDTGKSHILAIPKPNSEKEPEYYQILDDLARELTDKLKALKKLTPPPAPVVKPENLPTYQEKQREDRVDIVPDSPTPQTTVFLAEVTDDLMSQREEVKRYLELQGLKVLPNRRYDFPTQAILEQTIDIDLKQSVLFVQLLSPFLGTLQMVQCHRAQKLELPILQWRNRDLDVNAVENLAYRTLLTIHTVMAIGLVEFQQHILWFLNQPDNKLPAPLNTSNITGNELVFINAAPQNMHLAHQIEHQLIQQGLGCSLPLENANHASSAQIREDLDNNLQFCDAVIVLDDVNTDKIWVRSQLLQCQRARGKRELPFKVIVVCQHPNKSLVNIRLPNMHTFKCLPPFQNTCISQFIGAL